LGRVDNITNYRKVSKFYHNNPEVFNFVEDILKKSDLGIVSIDINEGQDEEKGEKFFFPTFNYTVGNKTKFLTYHDQSSGVKSLFLQLGMYKLVLSFGGTLVLDEFDINMHPDLLPELINFFESSKKNPNNAQFIFTTHNNEIMNSLGKYRVAFVNKEDNESYVYRLDEIPGDIIRNDRPITTVYEANKIGGRPKLEIS
jgi:AAA15 family ATPase/GTPase